jgi:hypothetical protein
MLISEVIGRLMAIQENHGELLAVCFDEYCGARVVGSITYEAAAEGFPDHVMLLGVEPLNGGKKTS